MQLRKTIVTKAIYGVAVLSLPLLLLQMAWAQTPLGDPPPLVPGLQSPQANPTADVPPTFNAPEQIQPLGSSPTGQPPNGAQTGGQRDGFTRNSLTPAKRSTVDCPFSNQPCGEVGSLSGVSPECRDFQSQRVPSGLQGRDFGSVRAFGAQSPNVLRGCQNSTFHSFPHRPGTPLRANIQTCPTGIACEAGW